MASEKTLEKKLREAVKKCKGLALKFYCLSFTGIPDRVVLMPGGRIWFVELKTTGKKLSPRQKIVIPQLLKLGFRVWIIDDQYKLDWFIGEIEEKYPPVCINYLMDHFKKFAA